MRYIFVHGLSGWGSYDKAYEKIPYWGMRGGDLIAFLRERGFDCHAASVAPTGSAWDRACEIYAQLAGTRTDYGRVHSSRCRHARFGRDFSACPLISDFGDDTRLTLLGHSFGGAAVRMFAELMAHGDPEEARETPPGDLSPLFKGGMEKRIHSVVTLASPMNGTTAYDLFRDPAFDAARVKVPRWSRVLAFMMSKGTAARDDGREKHDNANSDMHLDRAAALNRRMGTLPHVYYFSVPCSATLPQPDGTWRPVRGIEPLFTARALQIGAYAGRTEGGMTVDESWRESDGLVNTVSAAFPAGAPHKPLDKSGPEPGLWNVYPTVRGDHMYLQGGLMHRHDIRPFYLDMLTMISRLEGAGA